MFIDHNFFLLLRLYTVLRYIVKSGLNLLADTSGLVGVVRETAPLVALLGTLCERSWQGSPKVGGVDIVQPVWIREISINDVLRIDEEVLSCA